MKKRAIKPIKPMMAAILMISLVGSMVVSPVYAGDIDSGCLEIDEENVYEEGISTEAAFEEPEIEVLEESALGRYVDGENKDWGNEDYIRHRYLGLERGDKVTVTPDKDMYWDGVNEIEYRVKDYSVAYDPVSKCMYGIMSIPAIDNKVMPTAFVKIPDVEKVELDKEYEAEFMFDIDREMGHGYVQYTVQIIGQRIYLFVVHNYVIASPETKVNSDGSVTVNNNYICLLYSTDMEGKDLKLHMRVPYPSYDSTDKRPCWIYYGEIPRAIQKINGTL